MDVLQESIMFTKLQNALKDLRKITANHAERLMALNAENVKLRRIADAVRALKAGEAVAADEIDQALADLDAPADEVQNEASKAFEDMIIHGTGAVKVIEPGSIRHIPFEEMHRLDDLSTPLSPA